MTRIIRPLLTLLLTFTLCIASAVLVFHKALDASVWFQGWLQIVGMIVAFYFGERSALKSKDVEQ